MKSAQKCDVQFVLQLSEADRTMLDELSEMRGRASRGSIIRRLIQREHANAQRRIRRFLAEPG